MTESIRTIPEELAVPQDIPENNVEESTDLSYLHGDISKEEAEERLANKTGGPSFLEITMIPTRLALLSPLVTK